MVTTIHCVACQWLSGRCLAEVQIRLWSKPHKCLVIMPEALVQWSKEEKGEESALSFH